MFKQISFMEKISSSGRGYIQRYKNGLGMTRTMLLRFTGVDMMISDAELLKLVMDRYPEQPAQFLIEQFTVMKAGLIQANNKLAGMDSEALSESLCCEEEVQKEKNDSEPSAPKKKYTRRNLVVKPEEAISEQEIACCICGKTFQNLTTKHIQSHDLTVEEYKKLCGYGPEQKLISSKLLNKLQANVLKAQQAREKKKAE